MEQGMKQEWEWVLVPNLVLDAYFTIADFIFDKTA
jgi:hypothetical protein